MARIYPTIIKNFHGSDGEQLVLQALSSLNDEYTVFHSYRWLGEPGQRRAEGEADFLIFHPRKGILSVEVKAGGIAYRDGHWWQKNRHTGEEKAIDPLGQAAESQHKIINLIRKRYGVRFHLSVGRAVWFPSVCVSEKVPLPAEVVKEIILDQDSLSFPAESLERAFDYWQNNLGIKNEITPGQFKELIKFLMPTFEIVETISSTAKEDEVSYVRLTERQYSLLHFLKEQPVAAIHGPAGTGKTMLAVEKARMLAREGKKVLYLCFNEFLLKYLRNSDYDAEHITFHNVRTLAEELLEDDSIPIDKIVPFFEEFFASDYKDEDWQYPNIVVDEGQDIHDDVLEHLAFLAELNEGTFYAFYDRNQYIMTREKPEWLDKNAECRLVLYRNCRNTKEIASLASSVMGMKRDSYINEIHGRMPKVSLYEDGAGLQKIAEKFVKDMQAERLDLSEFVILTVRSVPKSLLKDVKTLAGVPVSKHREKGKIWFTSVRKFKGLEAKAVLLIDGTMSKLSDSLMQRLLYVGCTRASSYLKVALLEDVTKSESTRLLKEMAGDSQNGGRRESLKLLGMDLE